MFKDFDFSIYTALLEYAVFLCHLLYFYFDLNINQSWNVAKDELMIENIPFDNYDTQSENVGTHLNGYEKLWYRKHGQN